MKFFNKINKFLSMKKFNKKPLFEKLFYTTCYFSFRSAFE